MGYHIQYGKTIVKTDVQTQEYGNKRKPVFALTLLVLTVLGYTSYNYKDVLQEYILPGDAMVTVSALETLVSDIRAGESLRDSVTAFCLEIVEHADIPQ